jgi:hypothetical protein
MPPQVSASASAAPWLLQGEREADEGWRMKEDVLDVTVKSVRTAIATAETEYSAVGTAPAPVPYTKRHCGDTLLAKKYGTVAVQYKKGYCHASTRS